MTTPLEPRAAELLKLLVERYIQDGQPVGSRTLARAAHLELSPATIRNVMADLDELGLVVSPHTSAGRVPTVRGYRYFVDQLLAPERLGEQERQLIAEGLLAPSRAEELVQTASSLLSRLSTMAGVVTLPRRNLAILRRIEFLPLSGNRVLAILVVNQHEVQNRVLATERPYSADELQSYANALNDHFAGQDLPGLRRRLVDEALDAQDQINRVLREAARMAAAALGEARPEGGGDYVLAGGANLLGYQDLADVQRLRGLFDALDRKRELLQLFDQCLIADGVQIFIGEESGYRVLDEISVVTAPYFVDGQVAGRLGVIGPTRMAYHRIIPLVSETARLLGASLEQQG
ncbi:MAG TPA: heat-inducible transcriptional repressor HrcA [Nevskiaceae bacterium]|nr:heat-inducible transcriptional repressor HrcA [Nevskiaceae bacterium]